MNDPKKPLHELPEGFDSLDSEILYIDDPGDDIVRPIPRNRWAQAKAMRDMLYGPSDMQPPPDHPQE